MKIGRGRTEIRSGRIAPINHSVSLDRIPPTLRNILLFRELREMKSSEKALRPTQSVQSDWWENSPYPLHLAAYGGAFRGLPNRSPATPSSRDNQQSVARPRSSGA